MDVLEVLTDSGRSHKYRSDLNTKLKAEGSQLSEEIGQLKLKVQAYMSKQNFIKEVRDGMIQHGC